MKLIAGARFILQLGLETVLCVVESVSVVRLLEDMGVVAFSQQDPRWRYDKLLKSIYTLGNAGCAITCAAMVLSQVLDEMSPRTLNDVMRDKHTSSNGLLRWDAIPDCYPEAHYDGPVICWKDGPLIWRNKAADMNLVSAELAKGPLILEVDYRPGGKVQQHFVLAMAFTDDGKDLDIIDPLDGKQVRLLERYGQSGWDLKRAIYGLRLLRVEMG